MKKKTKKPPPYYLEGILDEIETTEKFQPSGNMGKWWKQVRLDKLKDKLKNLIK